MASARRPRLYHSSAVLLPDARILLAGGGAYGNAKNEKSGEIYSPPYLFKGPRPVVSAAPDALHYGQSFTVDTPDASRISKVSLVRMGSVTHNFDFDQRYMELNATVEGDGLRISGPSNANVAPPGYYMVFLVDDQGVPSTGQIVKVDPAVDTQPPTTVTGLAASARTDGAQLSWSAASDNTGVDEYRVFRSTTSGFTPSAANRIARVGSGTSYRDSGVGAGTYYYRVRAVDKAGNAGPASTQVQNVVTGDTTAPVVTLSAPPSGASLTGSVAVTATATDAIGVAGVQFKLDGQNLGAADTSAPYSVTWDTLAAPDGAHALTAVASDASGNAATSAAVPVEVHNTGLVAAYGFDETSGAAATDSLADHDGSISGATRVPDGRYGRALSFDGVDDSIGDPAFLGTEPGGRDDDRGLGEAHRADRVALGRRQGAGDGAAVRALRQHRRRASRRRASSPPPRSAPRARRRSALSQWTHLAMTWDGSVLRLYDDGAEIATQPAPGALLTSTGQLRIGGNSLRGEFFSGLIDEVRVYDRALPPARIGADMNLPVTP